MKHCSILSKSVFDNFHKGDMQQTRRMVGEATGGSGAP